ncbi:MAG: hypothetical protein ACD_42C00480G0002 [uncultured bacterium]|nr:MAG: hypothetical protein ACD_42C00480G0002 [uncultured bacterium]OGT25799.1 MAG: hypothetical protein A3B71_00015 [Gammaproteobacteria bacterium RIFCSPHIGHO2_02_FULL_42_43]OGT27235.1 MAG: hypothetical protein A2624_02700 [Gammaproteobacteria bacterium RIFCSPHIGHO2_01_FULL_42_8]OGT51881.1 MAG: hypothetical protein A3E54_01040 [Gammaproteobacteria bacterium RIFCSPHIGHO2_12_FULL_41_25]OGT62395.1 MAG: hypothetical protein A3I77_00015 [Gammaproteobacteria bacterium RIFCSPLOWO2_02_FULL_42_14]OGT
MKRLCLSFLFVMTIFAMHGIFAAHTAPAQKNHVHHATQKLSTQPVDINHADAAALATLKGIGPKKADTIVAYRTAHGAFHSVNDLTHVKGIGAKTLARLQAKNPGRLTVNKS